MIYGGAAGGGKSWALLYEPLRHVDNPDFGAVLFRASMTQITEQGGLWDESMKLYTLFPRARPIKSPKPYWKFPSGAKISFRQIARDADVYDWQGTQIALIEFDELTHFTEFEFFYMLSRNRSMCGVRPYVRASCNPDADSWVASFLSWWIDQDTGYAIPERSGKIRYMGRVNEQIFWGDTVDEVIDHARDADPDMKLEAHEVKSVTFILSTIQDNQALLKADPGYMANLKALSIVERERLLYGNWKIKAAKGLFFPRPAIGELLEDVPSDVVRWVRGWDLAATDTDEGGDPAYTASVLLGKRRDGSYVIADATNNRLRADKVRAMVKQCAAADKAQYKRVRIRMSQVAAQWQAGNVKVLAGAWTETLLGQYESFPESKFKDLVDSGSNAFNELEMMNAGSVPPAENGTGTTLKASYWFR